MGSNPSTESNYKTAVNSKNKMQMLCMQPGTTAEGYNQGREPKNSMHSSTEICNRICGHASHSAHRGNESAESPLALVSWEHCDVLSMQIDSDLVIYRTTLLRIFQVVTICRVDKSEVLVVLISPHDSKRH
ncbi:hypothetical protein F511_45864 [Dorcoceras hygrometricum]|uniref:Uncharacterized protein n=1 Tax=Dorcoceras hygrometricum TaxID=472368 RepID=A0A2Z7A2J2_9LAMI|nr:hypothetical protein F511_45864 [Dorcoceras hygrometricum]